MDEATMDIIVVGGGIAGLTFALSAHQLGLKVQVYESVREIAPLGVGLNLQPNAVRELSELGLEEVLATTAIPTAELAYYSKRGQLIWSEPRGAAAGYKWPQYSIHRGALHMALLAAVEERLGKGAVRTGHHLAGFQQSADSVVAQFIDRANGEQTVTVMGNLLVGADGIHSMVRRGLYPDEGAPRFGEWVMFRGATETQPFLSGKAMVSIGTRDQRVVAYPMSRQAMEGGRSLVNWVASLPVSLVGMMPPEEWNYTVGGGILTREFASWRFPWLDVVSLFENASTIYQFPFVDRDPIPKWSIGRVTLIGDAAHPMYPVGSQAGSQAIVDARVLASALKVFQNPLVALQRYEDMRMSAMNALVVKNRGLGAENILQIVEERAPAGFAKLEDVISQEELADIASSFKRLAGIDVEAVNNRSSYFGLT
jgi:5-methylphenazine-1-carboxylate 1-monooxygenase